MFKKSVSKKYLKKKYEYEENRLQNELKFNDFVEIQSNIKDYGYDMNDKELIISKMNILTKNG